MALWLCLIGLPLAALLVERPADASKSPPGRLLAVWIDSIGLSALIALAACTVGLAAGRVLAYAPSSGGLILTLMILPLVLPQHVLYYAWSLIASPTTAMGRWLAADMQRARFVSGSIGTIVQVSWYWPLAALFCSQGWRRIDADLVDCARLDADRFTIVRRIVVPLLAKPAAIAMGLCFVLSLSDFATFHLAGIRTIGTELALIYETTGSSAMPLGYSIPSVLIAMAMAIVLGQSGRGIHRSPSWRPRRVGVVSWVVTDMVWLFSLIAPAAILLGSVREEGVFRRYFALHIDDLAGSFIIALLTGLIALLLAAGILHLQRRGALIGRAAQWMETAVYLAMFLPGSLVAAGLLSLISLRSEADILRQSSLIVSFGQAARYGGVAMMLLHLLDQSRLRDLDEMAQVDGAGVLRRWRHVVWPFAGPVVAGTVLIVIMFSMTELSATMILLPAGVPNFAQRLLNQMHYARDQEVIASCVILMGFFGGLGWLATRFLRRGTIRSIARASILFLLAILIVGCYGRGATESPKVLGQFGRTGRADGDFIYPRGIAADSSRLYVVDKTGRIQWFTPKGQWQGLTQMPIIDTGKPVGLTVAPDGNLYVADTHYHRVAVFSPEGQLLKTFGEFGEKDGQFIYPTDIAFAPDGRLFVSEYGGNDRISVFDNDHKFLTSFGTIGSEPGQFSRPQAMCIDAQRAILYIADSCNHRIAVYDLHGKPLTFIGRMGRGPGELRYPYGLSLCPNGDLVVCEYGNNRIQVFDPQGNSRATFGTAGRASGQLAYPWSVFVDDHRRAYIVDAGNDRIQIWQL